MREKNPFKWKFLMQKVKSCDPFLKLEYKMLNSSAFTALSSNAVVAYIMIRIQFDYKGGGDQHLILTYAQMVWRMSRGTYSRVLNELKKYGFLELVNPGGLFRNPNVFKLSDRWTKYSLEIKEKKGKYAIQHKLALKPTHRNNANNLRKK